MNVYLVKHDPNTRLEPLAIPALMYTEWVVIEHNEERAAEMCGVHVDEVTVVKLGEVTDDCAFLTPWPIVEQSDYYA
jgi:hypothetical protein